MNNWNGVGLPPVGEKVIVNIGSTEFHIFKEIEGKTVEIAFHSEAFDGGDPVAVFKWVDSNAYRYHGLVEGNFLPIKSEREKAIEEMVEIYNANESVLISEAMKALYDAGYRKQELE